MRKKIKLESAIYHILSEEKGPSQKELFDELKNYSDLIKEHDIELNVDGGNLSRKLGSLEEKKIIFHKYKKVNDRDQNAHSYYIKNDFDAFRHILREFARDIDVAPRALDPRNLISSSEFNRLTFEQICSLIEDFIKSEYTNKLMKQYGFRSTYRVFREEVKAEECGFRRFLNLEEK